MNLRLSAGMGCALAAAFVVSQSCNSDCLNCPGEPATLTISPQAQYVPSVIPLDSVQLQVELLDRRQHFLPLNRRRISWQSLDNGIATVTDSGFVKGVAAGDARIVAAAAGLVDTGHVTVVTNPTFSQQVYPILLTTCGTGGCHVPTSDPNVPGAFTPRPPMNLPPANLYDSLLTSTRGYVTASDTTVGLLLARTRTVGAVGAQMPPQGRLSSSQPGNYHLIALWIAQGAVP
jgi:hypothetical protein